MDRSDGEPARAQREIERGLCAGSSRVRFKRVLIPSHMPTFRCRRFAAHRHAVATTATRHARITVLALACCLLAAPARAQPTSAPPRSSVTKIVMLGTGNPSPDPRKMGPAVAIVVNGMPYLVDAGVGVVRRIAAASRAGVAGFEAEKIRRVFLTHLHSDHTLGLPDLLLTPWIMGRTVPLEVYGPEGTAAMTDHIRRAWSADNEVRINGLERGNPTGNAVIPHEIGPGVVYRDSNVTVTAFLVRHGSWKQAFGYRFQTPDRTIVLSGDSSPTEAIVEQCAGCDVLLHEAYSEFGYRASPEPWRAYLRSFHTSTKELAALAGRARPKHLVLYHQMYFGGPSDTDARLVQEIRAVWQGPVIASKDLDVY
jgi:ribonuclease BN (tRNA processing enzyme)